MLNAFKVGMIGLGRIILFAHISQVIVRYSYVIIRYHIMQIVHGGKTFAVFAD